MATKLTLYQLDESIRELFENLPVDEDTGEILPEAAAQIDALHEQFEEKICGIGLYVKELKANAEACKEASAQLSARAKSLNSRADWLKSYALQHMQQNGLVKAENQLCKVSVAKGMPTVSI